jgi:hypothetical protein
VAIVLASAGAITKANSNGVSTGTATDLGFRTDSVSRRMVSVGIARTLLARVGLG